MNILVQCVLDYQEAVEKCDNCSSMFLSSGDSTEPARLMDDMYKKRERMFKFANILKIEEK